MLHTPRRSELINNLGNLSTKHTPPNQKSPQTIPTFHSNIFPNHVSLQSPPHTFLRSFYHIKEEGQPSTLTRPCHPLYLDLITFPQRDSWSKNKPHLHFVSKDALNNLKSLIISLPLFLGKQIFFQLIFPTHLNNFFPTHLTNFFSFPLPHP